jgi:hypothetical protein
MVNHRKLNLRVVVIAEIGALSAAEGGSCGRVSTDSMRSAAVSVDATHEDSQRSSRATPEAGLAWSRR